MESLTRFISDHVTTQTVIIIVLIIAIVIYVYGQKKSAKGSQPAEAPSANTLLDKLEQSGAVAPLTPPAEEVHDA